MANRPTLAHCPLCGATAFNPSLGKEAIRLYCESCRRFIHIGPKKPYGWVEQDLMQTFRYLLGIRPITQSQGMRKSSERLQSRQLWLIRKRERRPGLPRSVRMSRERPSSFRSRSWPEWEMGVTVVNKDDRKQLEETSGNLSIAKDELEALRGDLEDRRSNLEDAFQGGSPQIDALQEQIDTLQEAIDSLEEAEDTLGGLL